jgi:hypothetical protein
MILSHHARSATGTTIGKHNGKWETSMKWPLRHLYKMLRKASWGTIKVFFSLFIFLCCFPFCFPVVLSYCIPRCTTPSLDRSPRACLSANARALAENDSLHWDHRPGEAQRGVTTGRHNGRTITGKWCNMRNITFIVWELEKAAFVT